MYLQNYVYERLKESSNKYLLFIIIVYTKLIKKDCIKIYLFITYIIFHTISNYVLMIHNIIFHTIYLFHPLHTRKVAPSIYIYIHTRGYNIE